MADLQIGNNLGVAAKAITPTGFTNINGGAAVGTGLVNANADTVTAMRTRLAAISAGYYTATRLNEMSFNDMVYAIRVSDNPTSI